MADLQTLRLPFKTWTTTFSVSADGLISFTDKGVTTTLLDLGDIDWERIVVDLDVTSATGTTPTLDLKLKTVNTGLGTAIAAGTLNLTDGGGTACAMTQATAATREIKAFGRRNADADGAGVSNAGRFLSAYADLGGTTPVFGGRLTIYAGL